MKHPAALSPKSSVPGGKTDISLATRRGQQMTPIIAETGPILANLANAPSSSATSRGKSSARLHTPDTPSRTSSLPNQMPDTPLKRAPSREEDRRKMSTLDTIESLAEMVSGVPVDASFTFPVAGRRDSFGTSTPQLGEAGPSSWLQRRRSERERRMSGRVSRASTIELIKGPEGHRRRSVSIVTLRSLPAESRQHMSEVAWLGSDGVDRDSSDVSAFAYLPSTQPKAENAGIQHLDQQVLSSNDFDRAVTAMQFDPPIRAQTMEANRYSQLRGSLLFSMFNLIFAALFFVFEAPYLWFSFSPAVVAVAIYLFLITLAGFGTTALMDPGSTPRGLDGQAVTAASLGNAGQSFLLHNFDQLDENSPRKRLALAKFGQQMKNATWAATPREKIVPLPPKNAQICRAQVKPEEPNNNSGSEYAGPLSLQEERMRAIPLLDSSGRKTWLLYTASESDLLTPVKPILQHPFRSKRTKTRAARPAKVTDIDLSREVIPLQIIVNGLPVQLRWCSICRTYPNPRTFHCPTCNRCCRNFHYHCYWLNNDIGARTLPAFLGSLVVAIFLCGYVLIFAALHLNELSHEKPSGLVPGIQLPDISEYSGSFRVAVRGSPTSVIIFVMALSALCFFANRLFFHLLCAAQAQTVLQKRVRKEIVKRFRIKQPRNPFDTGSVARNFAASLFVPLDLTYSVRKHQVSPNKTLLPR